MVSVSECTKLVRRFASLPGYPRDAAEAVTTLAETLAAAMDSDHANRAVQDLLYGAERCPTPADIRRAVNQTKAAQRIVGCANCADGWRAAWMLRTREHGRWRVERIMPEFVESLRERIDWQTQVLYECRYECPCRTGGVL